MQPSLPKERVIEAYNAAPDEVRKAFNSPDTASAVDSIRMTYGLHIDTSGEVMRSVGYMLLGLVSPAEFFGQLVLSGFDQKSAREILDTLNSRIFLPLQARMREAKTFETAGAEEYVPYSVRENEYESAQLPETISPSTVHISKIHSNNQPNEVVGRPVLPPPSIEITPTQQATNHSQPPAAPATINLMEEGSHRPAAANTQLPPVPAAVADTRPAAPQFVPAVRTMQRDMELAQHPETIGMTANQDAQRGQSGMRYSPHPDHATPAVFFQTGSIPVAVPPRTAIPVDQNSSVAALPVIPPASASAPREQFLPGSVPAAPVPRPIPVNIDPATHEYAVDPYREPV